MAGVGALMSPACRQTPAPLTPALRVTLPYPDELVIGAPSHPFGLALAPDGRRLAFPAARVRASAPAEDAVAQLWLRDLTTDTLTPLSGTANGALPFWSPDGAALGFFAAGKLRMLQLATGRVEDLADAPSPRGGAWHADGDIVFAGGADTALMRRRPDGGVEAFTSLQEGESSHRFPRFLGTDHIVFYVRATETARRGIWVTRRDAPESRRRLVNADAAALVLDATLVYASGEALMAQRINLDALALEGRATLLGSAVGRDEEHQVFATTGGDVLLFGDQPSPMRTLRWVDRSGAPGAILGEPMIATDVRIAPAGGRVAVARVDPQLGTLDIWAYEDRRPIPRRVSPSIDADESPAWSPDGGRIAWVSGRRVVTIRDRQATTPEVVLHKTDQAVRVTGWSPDGRWVVTSESRPGTGADIVLLPAAITGGATPRVYAQAPFNETQGVVSPDGRWLAYASDESGLMEVYVDRFPAAGRRARLSIGGGSEPRWARSGRTLFFRRASAIHAVTLTGAEGALEAVSSERLFDAGAEIRSYDVTPDGTGFLLNLPQPGSATTPLTVLVHVRSLLPSAP